MPIALIGTSRFFAWHSNCKVFDIIHDPRLMFKAELKTFKRFPEVIFIPGFWPDYGAPVLPSGFGTRVYWNESTMPYIKWTRLFNISEVDKREVPDVRRDGIMPFYLKSLKLFRDKAGNQFETYTHFIWSTGPGELASYLRGQTNFLLDLYRRPEQVRQLLEICTDTIIEWLEVQLEIVDDAFGYLLTDDVSGLISQKMYDEFLLPFHAKISSAFRNKTMVFHCDSNTTHILESLTKMGMKVFNFSPDMELAAVRERIGNKVCLMGNVHPLNVMVRGTPRDVMNACMKCINAVKGERGYVLAPGGGTNEGTTVENIRAMILAAKKYGRY